MRKCPHANVVYCPLYHAAHTASKFGCDDGNLGNGDCAISRGQSYEGSVSALRIEQPGLVERLEWQSSEISRQQQRRRNMRALGIH